MKRDVLSNQSERCYICDHAFHMPKSDYLNLETVYTPDYPRNPKPSPAKKNRSWVSKDPRTGKPMCRECWDSIFNSVREMEEIDSWKESCIIVLEGEPDEEDKERPRR